MKKGDYVISPNFKGDYVICPKCKGRGKFFDNVACVMTFGLGYLFGKETCPRCHGTDFIKVK